MTRLLLLLCLAGSLMAGPSGADRPLVAPELEALLAEAAPDELIDIIVETRLQADLAALPPETGYDAKLAHLQSTARAAQRDLLAWLETTAAQNIRTTWLVSSVALSATPELVRALAARPDVAFLTDDFTVTVGAVPSPALSLATPAGPDLLNEWNITRVRAPECWAAGFNGAGIVVGNIDTGVSVSHPAFGGRWRSSNGWFDGVSGQSSPYDDNGHGTHCMGSAVGGNGIGVAPGASFVAAKGLNSQGSGQGSWLDACLDWMAGTGRPDVLSISWGGDRTSSYFFTRFWNLRNLGVVVVGAAGNNGPGGSTAQTPANFPICISVGATTSTDAIASFSSRGPSPEQPPWSNRLYWSRQDWDYINPVISAPGANIRSAVPGGGYYSLDGTSMSAPHVAGAAAILLQKKPDLDHDEIFNLLTDYADRPSGGAPYPNNNYGWGRLNVKTALDNVGGGPGGEDTLRVHYVYAENAVGLEEGGSFYAAARLTPARTCDVIAGIFLQHEASQNQRFFVWRGNTATSPGPVVESIPYTGAGTGWKRADLAQPLRVSAGQDFWLGPRFQHSPGQFPGGVDVGPPVAQRGGWARIDTVWEELRDYGLNFNWMIAALVRYDGAVEEELLLPVPNEPRLGAPAVARGSGRIRYALPVSAPVRLEVYDPTGRLVRNLVRGPVPAGEHFLDWDRRDDSGRTLPAGAYLYRLTVDRRSYSARSVLLD